MLSANSLYQEPLPTMLEFNVDKWIINRKTELKYVSALPTAHNQNINFADVLAMFIPEKAASVYSAVLMAFQLTLA